VFERIHDIYYVLASRALPLAICRLEATDHLAGADARHQAAAVRSNAAAEMRVETQPENYCSAATQAHVRRALTCPVSWPPCRVCVMSVILLRRATAATPPSTPAPSAAAPSGPQPPSPPPAAAAASAAPLAALDAGAARAAPLTPASASASAEGQPPAAAAPAALHSVAAAPPLRNNHAASLPPPPVAVDGDGAAQGRHTVVGPFADILNSDSPCHIATVCRQAQEEQPSPGARGRISASLST
jgi:hypothetical protein